MSRRPREGSSGTATGNHGSSAGTNGLSSFNIHGIELHFGRPSMIGVVPINRLSAFEIFPSIGGTTSVVSRWVVSPWSPIGVDHSKFPQVITGKSYGGELFELGFNVALP